MSDISADQFGLQHLVKDPEISDRIGGQVLALQPNVYLPKDRQDDLWEIVINLMKKLEKTKHHADRCEGLTREVIANTLPPATGVQYADHTSGIEAEVEAFLFQCKATLDLLVKLLRPAARLNLATFGDKGDLVIKSLRRNVPKDRADRAAALVGLIEHDRPWLTKMIALRDTVGHFSGLPSTGVRSQQRSETSVVIEPRGKDGVPLSTMVATCYSNLLGFAEDFLALALNLAMPPMLCVTLVDENDRRGTSKHRYGIGALNLPK